jgi:hypothetical protein
LFIFDTLVGGSRVFFGYVGASLMMAIAATVEWSFGIDSERKSLEEVARPLTFAVRDLMSAFYSFPPSLSPSSFGRLRQLLDGDETQSERRPRLTRDPDRLID